MFPFRRMGGVFSLTSHDRSPSASEEAWEPEVEGLLYLASVGEDGIDLNPIVEALGGSSSHIDMNLTFFKAVLGIQR